MLPALIFQPRLQVIIAQSLILVWSSLEIKKACFFIMSPKFSVRHETQVKNTAEDTKYG